MKTYIQVFLSLPLTLPLVILNKIANGLLDLVEYCDGSKVYRAYGRVIVFLTKGMK